MRNRFWALALTASMVTACSAEDPFSPDMLELRLEHQDSVTHGEQMFFTMRVTNPTPRQITIIVTTDEIDRAFDPLVSNSEGVPVWRGAAGIFSGGPGGLTLDAGETRTFTKAWDLIGADGSPVPPGIYQIVGRLLGEADAVLQKTPGSYFHVVP